MRHTDSEIAVCEELAELRALKAEMLEALKAARAWIEDELDWRDAYLDRCKEYQKVVAAIAKAEGEEPA